MMLFFIMGFLFSDSQPAITALGPSPLLPDQQAIDSEKRH